MTNYYTEVADYYREQKESKLPHNFQCINCNKIVFEVKGATSTCKECVEKVAAVLDGLENWL